MKQRITCMILLAGLVTMLAGCSEPFNGKTAGQVSFTISAKSSPDTKTAYSGDLVTENNKLYERINWVAGDQIRIYSSDKSQVGVGVVNHVADPVDHYDYTIGTVTANGRKSDATVNKPAEGEGLTWVDDPYGVLFYGTYPPLAATYDNAGKLMSFTGMTIPRDQTTTVDMDHAYMLAAPAQFVESTQLDESGNKIPKMHMDFYPAFNAFYIVLGSQRGEIAIDSIKLTTTTDDGYLSGSYSYNNPQSQLTNGPIVNGIVYGSDNNNSVKVALPSGTKIKPGENGAAGDSVKVTLLTLPPQTGTGLTNMVLNVYHDGKPQPASLKLNYSNGNPINFTAFHKARITGLAMEGGSKWKLTIDDQVLPWIEDEQKTSFRNQIGITGRTPVSGYIETTEVNEPGGPSNWENYYTRLTVDCSATDPCIVFTFTPTAPIGGYWRLKPEAVIPGSLDFFEITTSDMINGESERLQGQVMVQPVNIYIRPTAEYLALDPAPVYSIIIHCDMSPSVTFDPVFSADSEFQRPYSDGRFGYYKFVIAK